MKLSTRGRYGLRAMYVLGKNYGSDPVPLSEIAEQTELSTSYLEQLIRRLKKSELVDSARGFQGGYFLTRSPADITVGEILESLEDFFGITECSHENGHCNNESQCTVRGVWIELSKEITEKANSITLEDVVSGKYKG